MLSIIKILLPCKLIAINQYIKLAILTIIIVTNNLITNRVEAKKYPNINFVNHLKPPKLHRKIALKYNSTKSAKHKFKNAVITQVFTEIPTNILPNLKPSLPELINPFQSPESSPEENNIIEPITPNEENSNQVLKKKL